jgi:hypothetical protein
MAVDTDFDSFSWSVGTANQDGRPLVIRFRQIPNTFNKQLYPYRLNLFWRMNASTQAGLPDESESEKLEQFEDRLIESVEPDAFAILAVVLTGGGEREFVFHSKDRAGFVDRLTHMPQEQERYPLDIQAYHDPAWDYLDSVTLPFRQEGQ